VPAKPFEFPKFDRAEYLRLNAECVTRTAERLAAESEAAEREISDAEWAAKKAADRVILAQQVWVARRQAERALEEAMASPLVDVIDWNGEVVGTGHLTGDPKSEWFGLDYRASFRRSCHTIVPAAQ
jgi:hypothetical protein